MTAAWPTPRPGILAIDPYVPGRSKTAAGQTLHKLSSNESPFGASPAAIAAYREAASEIGRYPDGDAHLLREAIAGRHGLDARRIVCGDGSFEVLNLIAQAYLQPGDEAIYSAYGFLLYRIATLSAGGTPIVAPERDLMANVDAILAAVTPRTKIVFLTNPNNPTGTYLPRSEITRLHAHLPETVLLVLDAAYAEYVRETDFEAGLALAADAPNVVMTRTFSKAYGLAALRLGWCTGPAAVIDTLNRIRGPFNVSAPAIAAGVAAMADVAHIDRTVDHNELWREKVAAALTGLGLTVTPSVANFLLIHFADQPGRSAADADAFLLSRGIVLRRMDAYSLPGALRMTIGSATANTDTIDVLREFMEPKP